MTIAKGIMSTLLTLIVITLWIITALSVVTVFQLFIRGLNPLKSEKISINDPRITQMDPSDYPLSGT